MASSDTVSFVTAIRQLRWCNIQFRSLRDTQHLRAAILNPVRLPQFQSLPEPGLCALFTSGLDFRSQMGRSLLYSDSDGVRLVSRNGNLFKSFPGLCEGLARDLKGRRCVLDGEIVCLDPQGKPQDSGGRVGRKRHVARRRMI